MPKTIKASYVETNAVWPEKLPELTGPEAVRAAKRLWRFAMGSTYTGKVVVTSGNRYSWERHGTFSVNPTKGWHRFIHDLSHLFHYRCNPSERPHSKWHAGLERKLVNEVIKRGWLDGKLRDPEPVAKSTDAKRRQKLERILAAQCRWEAKQRRAKNALRKLAKQQRYYERVLSA